MLDQAAGGTTTGGRGAGGGPPGIGSGGSVSVGGSTGLAGGTSGGGPSGGMAGASSVSGGGIPGSGGSGGSATAGAAGRASTDGTGGSAIGGAGGGMSGQSCPASQHSCSGSCVDDSPAHCGSSCMACSAPAGGTAVCSGGACDFTCGAMKKCGQKCITPAEGQCCADQDCLKGFACAAGACKKSCSTSSDCQPDYFCDPSDGACHSDVVSVAVGSYHTCAALKDGRVMCWGDNTFGELGIGTTDAVQGAVQVRGISNASLLKANKYSTCALGTDGTASCWGDYVSAPEPDTLLGSRSPFAVSTSTGKVTGIKVIELGSGDGCVVAGTGTYCWATTEYSLGFNSNGGTISPATLLSSAGVPSLLGMGGDFQVAAYGANSVCPWGTNYVRAGASPGSSAPQGNCFDIGAKVAQFALGQSTLCVRRIDSKVVCWGPNDVGQVGPASTADPVDPPGVQVSGLNASDITAGIDYTCAIPVDNPRTLVCWGHTSGQLRVIAPDLPTGIQFSKVGAGTKAFGFCGILSDGSLLCWDVSGTPRLVPSSW